MKDNKYDQVIIDDPEAPTSNTDEASLAAQNRVAVQSRVHYQDVSSAAAVRIPREMLNLKRAVPRSVRGQPSWWAERQADAIERRQRGEKAPPSPPVRSNEKPEAPTGPVEAFGATRQERRLAYRKTCKELGFKPRRSERAK